jgi:phosphoheptose isomerase
MSTTTTPSTIDAERIAGDHIAAALPAIEALQAESDRLAEWGSTLAARLLGGARLLAAGNGGSAAEAQHLTAELVGRFDGDRRAFSAICLHGDTSALTAIGNDYGVEEVFARQVEAHARPGDVCLLMSTSGRSPNLLRAAERARDIGIAVWAMTGPAPNPLAALSDELLAVDCAEGATVQEVHLVAVHLLCEAFDDALGVRPLADRLTAVTP